MHGECFAANDLLNPARVFIFVFFRALWLKEGKIATILPHFLHGFAVNQSDFDLIESESGARRAEIKTNEY